MPPRRILLAVLFLCLTAAAFWKFRAESASSKEWILHGNVDIREVNLGFRVAGKVSEVFKDEGDTVQVGDVIARLDNGPQVRDVEEATAQTASLRARLDLLRRGYRQEEIAQAKAILSEREATLANSERIRARKQDLADRHVIPAQEVDDANAARDEALARRNSAQASLALVNSGYRREEIQQAEADLAHAEALLAAAQLRKDDTVLKAPEPGVIMTRAVESGAIVQAGATAVTVSLQRPVWIRLYVHEPDLGRIHPGQTVRIFTDTRPDRPYVGKIGFISPRAEFTPKSVETTELRTQLVYRLRVTIDDPDDGLRQGMPVTARLMGSSTNGP